MVFERPLIEGVLLKRYKRFLADVKLTNTGEVVTAHTPNTGSMIGCSQPGFKVWLQHIHNPKRKYPFSWELVQSENNIIIGINTLLANKLVREGIENRKISELGGYQNIKSEVRYGNENSRIDFLLQSQNLPYCYLEVKNVTLAHDNIAFFPDAKSERGLKHLRELITNINQGNRSVIFFCIQREDAESFSPAHDIHPEYASQLYEANKSGVEVLAYTCKVSINSIEISTPVPVVY